MSGVLPHLDECHDDPESFLKAVRPDLWDWLVGWLQQQQLEAVAVSAPEGDDDGAESLKQLGYEQLDNSSGSGASTAFDGGGASPALDGGDDALDGGDSKSKDGDTGQSQMLCNFPAATGSQSKYGDADPPHMLGNLEGARAGEDSQVSTACRAVDGRRRPLSGRRKPSTCQIQKSLWPAFCLVKCWSW